MTPPRDPEPTNTFGSAGENMDEKVYPGRLAILDTVSFMMMIR